MYRLNATCAMTNFETNLRKVLTREAVRFCSRIIRLFPGPARANAYSPHTGLSSTVVLAGPYESYDKSHYFMNNSAVANGLA